MVMSAFGSWCRILEFDKGSRIGPKMAAAVNVLKHCVCVCFIVNANVVSVRVLFITQERNYVA